MPEKLKENIQFNQNCLEIGVLPVDKFMESSQKLLTGTYSDLVENNPDNIKYVPAEYADISIYLQAIKTKLHSLEFVNPDSLFYHEVCFKAISQNSETFEYIPQDKITEKILLEKEKSRPVRLSEIPDRFHTYERCIRSLTIDTSTALSIPSRFFQEYPNLATLIMEIDISSRNSPCLLSALPEVQKTEEFCQKYLDRFPHDIDGVPLLLLKKHPNWVIQAVKLNQYTLLNLPLEIQTADLWKQFSRPYPGLIKHIPESILRKSPDLVLLVADLGELKTIPTAMRSLDIYMAAVSSEPTNFKYVPEPIRQKMPYDFLLTIAPSICHWRFAIR